MLAKHYYQASANWVVFFVPQSDADMSYYNEFMNYLGEKRRAAVAKLDDKNTLFLVPPSDFSQEVLKVPGKLSISGVVLRLEPPPPPTVFSLPPIQERKDVNTNSFHSDMLYPRSEPPRFSGYDHQRMPDSADVGHDYVPNHLLNAVSLPKQGLMNPINQDYASSGFQRSSQDANFGISYNSNSSSASLPTAFSALQQDQLAQLASSLLGQHQIQPGSSSSATAGSERQSGFLGQSEITLPQRYNPPQPTQAPPGFSGLPQFQQSQPQMQQQHQPQVQQAGNNALTVTAEGAQETEGDPQKRLQATLQLAAALLQQIQQGKGT